MLRKQVYVDEEIERGLKALAAATGRSEAEHVREALRGYLRDRVPEPAAEDPLLGLVGLVGGSHGPDDVAEQHDHYLYSAPKERRRRRTAAG